MASGLLVWCHRQLHGEEEFPKLVPYNVKNIN
jgi:hypothetical protein